MQVKNGTEDQLDRVLTGIRAAVLDVAEVSHVTREHEPCREIHRDTPILSQACATPAPVRR